MYQRHWDLLSQTVIIGFIGSDKNTSTAGKHHDVDIMIISNHWIFNDTHVVTVVVFLPVPSLENHETYPDAKNLFQHAIPSGNLT